MNCTRMPANSVFQLDDQCTRNGSKFTIKLQNGRNNKKKSNSSNCISFVLVSNRVGHYCKKSHRIPFFHFILPVLVCSIPVFGEKLPEWGPPLEVLPVGQLVLRVRHVGVLPVLVSLYYTLSCVNYCWRTTKIFDQQKYYNYHFYCHNNNNNNSCNCNCNCNYNNTITIIITTQGLEESPIPPNRTSKIDNHCCFGCQYTRCFEKQNVFERRDLAVYFVQMTCQPHVFINAIFSILFCQYL